MTAYSITVPGSDNELVVSDEFSDVVLGHLIKCEMKKFDRIEVSVTEDDPWDDHE